MSRLVDYLKTRITPFDLLKSKLTLDPDKMKIGWCGPFPPSASGGAAVTYWFVNRMLQRKDIAIYGIPNSSRATRDLFPGLKFEKVNSSFLDVIIFYLPESFHDISKIKEKPKTVVYQTVHNPLEGFDGLPLMKGYPLPSSTYEKELLARIKDSDLIITPTKWAMEEYLKNGIERIDYVPHGVDSNVFTPSQKDDIEVLFLSRILYYKGIVPFLESAKIILKERPETKFKISGQVDENTLYLDEISALIKEVKSEYPNNILFDEKWGGYEQIREKYSSSSIFVFPSNNEGFGVPMIEAMSCGLPCIVLDRPPMNEIVVNNKTGFCLPMMPNIEDEYHGMAFPHPEDIAEKVLWLIDNPAERKKMGENGRKWVKDEYELNDCVEKMINCVKNVVE